MYGDFKSWKEMRDISVLKNWIVSRRERFFHEIIINNRYGIEISGKKHPTASPSEIIIEETIVDFKTAIAYKAELDLIRMTFRHTVYAVDERARALWRNAPELGGVEGDFKTLLHTVALDPYGNPKWISAYVRYEDWVDYEERELEKEPLPEVEEEEDYEAEL